MNGLQRNTCKAFFTNLSAKRHFVLAMDHAQKGIVEG
jgi:hypothetical protein